MGKEIWERETKKHSWGKRVGKRDMGKKKWCRKDVRETSGIGEATLQLLALQYISVPSTCQLPQTILSKHSKACVWSPLLLLYSFIHSFIHSYDKTEISLKHSEQVLFIYGIHIYILKEHTLLHTTNM